MTTLALCSDSNGTSAYVTSAQIYGKLVADDLGMTFVNPSVSGYTSGQISTLVSSVLSTADWIIACPGTNDFSNAVTSGAKIHDVIKTLCDNVGTMCDNAIAAGKQLTVMSPIFPKSVMQIHQLDAEKALARVCSQKGVDFIPLTSHMLNVFSNKQETDIATYYTVDGWHGTAVWHQMVADLILSRQHGTASAPPPGGPVIIYQLASQTFTGTPLSVTDSPDFAFGTDNFVIEMDIKYTTLGGFIVCQRSGTSSYFLLYNASGLMKFDVVNGSVLANPSWSWSPVAGTTYAIKLERIGSAFKFYVNGSQVGSTVSQAVTIPDFAAPLVIGGDTFSGTGQLYAKIDNLKITRG